MATRATTPAGYYAVTFKVRTYSGTWDEMPRWRRVYGANKRDAVAIARRMEYAMCPALRDVKLVSAKLHRDQVTPGLFG